MVDRLPGERRSVELSAGTIEYTDTGGDGPVLVMLHGPPMNATVWRRVVAELPGEYRCVLPTWPLGGHRIPMRADADLSLRGLGLLVGEFLERLDLREVTLVLNDWGGGQVLLTERRTDRLARVVLTSCEAFDNYPPGIPGKLLGVLGRVPGGIAALLQLLRFRAVQRAPGGWGWMSKRPIPRDVQRDWFTPGRTDAAVRRDLIRYGRGIPPKRTLREWAAEMSSFDRPVLVAWAAEDKLMPRDHGRRLADLFPEGRLVEVPDSRTLIPEDNPEFLARALREFIADTPVTQLRP
ncbi:pimeloyl-ACP methyl ester carboxylesterase [Prauserella isguenensis]|uniref:Pimeloyl-ACP methyl ester carboxylesterase n=1 Tax=Prauserella isguenensis TaxID=1470180 RepID=A0A839S244_9PSEU|nr:alpha/beta hydrolase [Prauserella isguenensis]MBB3052161.1 pimeloyl-ACP methyl ester carboxylesterase [Prauserella isguenensis]